MLSDPQNRAPVLGRLARVFDASPSVHPWLWRCSSSSKKDQDYALHPKGPLNVFSALIKPDATPGPVGSRGCPPWHLPHLSQDPRWGVLPAPVSQDPRLHRSRPLSARQLQAPVWLRNDLDSNRDKTQGLTAPHPATPNSLTHHWLCPRLLGLLQ